ncbi:MAG: hypothetical protein RR837_02185, partial [Bacteroidales bacterium]
MKIFQTRLFLLSLLVGLFAGVFGSAFRWCLNKSLIVRELMFRHDQTFLYHALVFAAMWLLAMGIYWLTRHVPLIGGSGIP